MRIGFDVDGVLADFPTTYQKLIATTIGRDDFEPGDADNPPCWDWPALRGYTKDEMSRVWRAIRQSKSFWYSLKPLPHLATLEMMIPDLEHGHDIYYITSRPGDLAKRQTEAWLMRHMPYHDMGVHPTVMVVGHMVKGAAARALGLSLYIDDNLENAIDVAVNSDARSYLLDRPYNQGSLPRGCKRVKTLGEMFDLELENL